MSKIQQETKEWLEEYYNKPENWVRLMVKSAVLDMAISLKKTREEKGISQRKLSEITGVAQSTISKAEGGRVISNETIAKISLALGLKPKLGFEKV